ncbi:MAG: hypothetical protein HQL31_04355, partial [Planctomycetes bacterium]|nr:hypothetical protein [Planctomycetota bacterium]
LRQELSPSGKWFLYDSERRVFAAEAGGGLLRRLRVPLIPTGALERHLMRALDAAPAPDCAESTSQTMAPAQLPIT